ncbi:membrane integrity-associated transporter subunit PqiC [Luteolibacter pohnpeiensis]|uniref:Membrane integrity-associated transporter subunit PqiC n=1 Tax=Luteolibacter pohnpeiensis TaxID=454153 RepID=A0A934SFN2_9BACT|nr:PqiC family protein [Luteolibacter pohnpeiensis]MBK1884313.1 membrane integrity-associated transporter subunit PqiC [Luteolibacter pohnpeiensis]
MKFQAALTFALPFFLAACGSVFQPVKDSAVNHLLDPAVPERSLTKETPAIAIARPALPGYLDRQQFVSRKNNGELEMNTNHLWAEPLDTGISRVLAIDLARLTGSLNIQPIENYVTMDYGSLVEIRISRFEPDSSGHLVFHCTWKLQPVHGAVAASHSFQTEVQLVDSQSPMSERVRAMNEALARLAREISSHL